MDELELKNVIATNIIFYRKGLGLTQLELADKLNYSDKAISKWERAEAMPDIFILKKLAKLFGISLDTLTNPSPPQKIKIGPYFIRKKIIVPLLSAGLVWLVATIIFVILMMSVPHLKAWMAFIYAIPASIIVLIVFNGLWGNPTVTLILVSALTWTIALSIFLTIPIENRRFIFLIPLPLQILTVLWYILRISKKNLKNR